jgi:hypothetical protein
MAHDFGSAAVAVHETVRVSDRAAVRAHGQPT